MKKSSGDFGSLPTGFNPRLAKTQRLEKKRKRIRLAKKIGIAIAVGATAILGGKPLFHLLGERLDTDLGFQEQRNDQHKKMREQGEPRNFYKAPSDSSFGGM